MTEEEILRKKLDWINQNSYYGIMIDTEITDIVRRHIKRLEEKEMNATSVQTIENVKEMHFTIEKSCVDDITKVIVVASTNDDIFEFHFSGEGCVVFADQWFNMVSDKAYKADFESERNKRQMMETENSILRRNKKKYEEKIGELEKELGEWKKEASEYLKDVDGVRREKNKEINELKQQLQQAANDKRRYEEKIKNLKHVDMLDKNAADYWSKEHDTLSERFDKLQEENKKLKDKLEQEYKTECKNCLACPSLVDDYLKLAKKNEQLTFEKEMIKKENDELREELALEKSVNEAQHKFIREYAGKGTEVQFNYAIDDAKEVSYVIVDKEESKQENHKNTRADILDQAKKCVCGQREQDYGTPESNFQLIADLWNDYLKKERLGRSKTVVDAVDVSMMMALLKIARIKNGGGSGDSFVDLAGYAACGGEIWHGQKVKDQN